MLWEIFLPKFYTRGKSHNEPLDTLHLLWNRKSFFFFMEELPKRRFVLFTKGCNNWFLYVFLKHDKTLKDLFKYILIYINIYIHSYVCKYIYIYIYTYFIHLIYNVRAALVSKKFIFPYKFRLFLRYSSKKDVSPSSA